jgi:ParB-like chromosome segregation protein Spo0J
MVEIIHIETSKLKLHPNNPRILKDNQFKILCDSIASNPDFFEARPILCNTDFVVFAGNMRLRASRELKLKTVPCVVMDIPEERQNEIMIRDNVSNGEFDWDMLANDWDESDLNNWGLSLPTLKDKSDMENVILNPLFEVAVECSSEQEQRDAYEKLIQQGYKCRILTL